jgi:tetratricopeptide (TPR) repeat protein
LTVWAQNNTDLSGIINTCLTIEEGEFDKDSLLHYASVAYQLSKDLGNTKEAALSKIYYGAAHFRKDTSVFFLEIIESIKINETIKFHEGIALCQLLLGRKLNDLGRYEESLEKIQLAESAILREKNISIERKNLILCKIAYLRSSVYNSTGQYKEALDVGLKSLEYAQLSQDSMILFKSYNNLSVTYGELSSPDKNLGTIEAQKRYGIFALEILTKAHELSTKMYIPFQRSVSGFNLALMHSHNKEFDKSSKLLYHVIRSTYRAKMPVLRYHAYDVMSYIFLDAITNGNKVRYTSSKNKKVPNEMVVVHLFFHVEKRSTCIKQSTSNNPVKTLSG